MNLAAVGRRYIGSESLEKSSRKNILISKIQQIKLCLLFHRLEGIPHIKMKVTLFDGNCA